MKLISRTPASPADIYGHRPKTPTVKEQRNLVTEMAIIATFDCLLQTANRTLVNSEMRVYLTDKFRRKKLFLDKRRFTIPNSLVTIEFIKELLPKLLGYQTNVWQMICRTCHNHLPVLTMVNRISGHLELRHLLICPYCQKEKSLGKPKVAPRIMFHLTDVE